MRRLLPALLGATLLLGACGDDDDGDRSAATSVPDETSTSSTSSATTEPPTVAPDVIPQDETQITEEYVEQVLNELYEVSLQALEHTREAGLVDEVTVQIVESINTQAHSRDVLNGLVDLSARSFEGYRSDPSPATAKVVEVIRRSAGCVFAEVRFDTSLLVSTPVTVPANVRGFARLLPATDDQRASGHNPTAWTVDALPVTEDGSVPEATCPTS